MRAPLPLALAVALGLAAGSCGDGPKIRDDAPEHLVEDLARAMRPFAREWLDEENAVELGPAGMGAVASVDFSASVIRFQRVLERGRALCDPWLPREVLRLQVPNDWHPRLRALFVSLALAEPEAIAATAAPAAASGGEARVTLRVGDEDWIMTLRAVKKSWEFAAPPRRVP